MIDKEKVEEVAWKTAEDNFDCDAVICGINCFKEGINWLLGNLKHPMSENPKMGDLVLIVRNMEQYEQKHGNRNVNLAFTHELDFHDNWETTYAKNPEYEYWININEIIDLLKKKL